MPAKKKLTEAAIETPAPAPKRRAAARPKKSETAPAVAEAAPAVKPKAKAPAKKKAEPKTPAATHKAPARKVTPRKPAVKATPFDIEAHRAEIEREAYYLWIHRGGVHGSDHEDWNRAVGIVKERHS
jgi:hypothetical protein